MDSQAHKSEEAFGANRSKVSGVSVDIHQNQKDRFNQLQNENHLNQAIDGDDIYFCYDWDDKNRKQRSMISHGGVGATFGSGIS